MIRPIRNALSALHSEHGVTLIELLVAMVAGAVVIVALITIIDTTLHQTTRTFSRVDATERSRTMLEQVENELHSACIGEQLTPVQSGSTGNSLIFESLYGNPSTLATQYANVASPTPVEHEIDFNAGASTLTDKIFLATGQVSGAWAFNTTPASTTTVLTNVGQSLTTPVFQYYAYQQPMNGGTPYTDAAGNPYMMLLDGTSSVPGTSVIPTAAPLVPTAPATSLSATQAASVAEVQITMNVGPALSGSGVVVQGESTTVADARATVNDSVVFRVTPAANDTSGGAVFAPCQ